MKCPYCGSEGSGVVDTRPVEENNSIRRRRECFVCRKRFTTYENVETVPLIVIKKDDTREPYDRHKIEAGIVRACYKCPVSMTQISAIVDEVEAETFSTGDREVSTCRIGEIVMKKLKEVDAVAYVRFASVYREFKDVNTFMDELKKFLE